MLVETVVVVSVAGKCLAKKKCVDVMNPWVKETLTRMPAKNYKFLVPLGGVRVRINILKVYSLGP